MQRAILCFAALAVVAASCSSGTEAATSAPESSSTTVAAQTGEDGSTTSTTVEGTTTMPPETEASPSTAAPIDGPPAPDFTLALGDGGEFTLSAEQKPVYLVFWAEW